MSSAIVLFDTLATEPDAVCGSGDGTGLSYAHHHFIGGNGIGQGLRAEWGRGYGHCDGNGSSEALRD
jgi:hypothetical protein